MTLEASPNLQSGIDLRYVDADVRPQDDLFGHVNGRWLRDAHLPGQEWFDVDAAVGDSFSEGMSEPDPRTPDAYLGWADRLADAIARRLEESQGGAAASFRYANLAVRGRKLDDVLDNQLKHALPMGADLVSIVGGGNDILRPKADLDAIVSGALTVLVRAEPQDLYLPELAPSDQERVDSFAKRGRAAATLQMTHRADLRAANLDFRALIGFVRPASGRA